MEADPCLALPPGSFSLATNLSVWSWSGNTHVPPMSSTAQEAGKGAGRAIQGCLFDTCLVTNMSPAFPGPILEAEDKGPKEANRAPSGAPRCPCSTAPRTRTEPEPWRAGHALRRPTGGGSEFAFQQRLGEQTPRASQAVSRAGLGWEGSPSSRAQGCGATRERAEAAAPADAARLLRAPGLCPHSAFKTWLLRLRLGNKLAAELQATLPVITDN